MSWCPCKDGIAYFSKGDIEKVNILDTGTLPELLAIFIRGGDFYIETNADPTGECTEENLYHFPIFYCPFCGKKLSELTPEHEFMREIFKANDEK